MFSGHHYLIGSLTITAPYTTANEARKGLYAPCIACHGAKGDGNAELQAPALAGQDAAYLERQLQHFKSGVRGGDPKDTLGAQMRGMAATLVDKQAIKDVSAYIAALASMPAADKIAVIGTPEPEGMVLDIGAEKTYNAPKLKGGFKVPTLRNIASTAPYMHSGRFATLRDTVEFYTKGRGHAVLEGINMQLHWHIWEPDLSDYELDRLVDFLQTLTDESFKPQIPKRVPSGLTPVDHKPTTLTLRGEP